MFKIIILEDSQSMAKAAFKVVSDVLDTNSNAVLGMATGSSPVGLYQEMVKDYQTNRRSYNQIKTFNLDEYVGLPQIHSQSYYSFMRQHLFDHIDIQPQNIHIPNGKASDLYLECQSYEQKLSDVHIDLQILGIGTNAHIGFNEPGTSFDSITHLVSLKEQTRQDNARFFDSIDDVPTQAITMGIASIMKAGKILLIASSTSKALAIANMIQGPITESVPASILQRHPDVTIIIDKAAASELINE